jgi:hypothetical protein
MITPITKTPLSTFNAMKSPVKAEEKRAKKATEIKSSNIRIPIRRSASGLMNLL